MDRDELEHLVQRLHDHTPLFGTRARRTACEKLAQSNNADALPYLVEALYDTDSLVKETAYNSLSNLKDSYSVNILCALWAKERDAILGTIIEEQAYIATHPVEIRVLSALKAGRPEFAGNSPDSVPVLISLRRDRDSKVSHVCDKALRSLSTQEAVDALCAIWARDRDKGLGRIIEEEKMVAAKPVKIRMLSAIKSNMLNCAMENPDCISALCVLMYDREKIIAQTAQQILRRLPDLTLIDRLCSIWSLNRDSAIGNMIKECGYVASAPIELHVLSAFQAEKTCLISDNPDAVPVLSALLSDSDTTISEQANKILCSLTNQLSIDVLCALWAGNRKQELGDIIAQSQYVASHPTEVRLLSFLKSDKNLCPDEQLSMVLPLVIMISDKDTVLAKRAATMLRTISDLEAQSALCRITLRDPTGLLAKICVDCGYRPLKRQELCLFLFLTRQLEEYIKVDKDFKYLRMSFEQGDPLIKTFIKTVIQLEKERFEDFFVGKVPVSECSDTEIMKAIHSCILKKNFSLLFRAFLQIPFKFGYSLMDQFRRSNWLPDTYEMRKLYEQILKNDIEGIMPEINKYFSTSALLKQWLATPLLGTEESLLEQLQTATPQNAVSIVGGLSIFKESKYKYADIVRDNPHFLVRMAGYVSGLCLDLSNDDIPDENFWVENIAGIGALLEFWPVATSPTDLDSYLPVSNHDWIGKYGALRNILFSIMTYIKESSPRELSIEFDEFIE
jgi:hypothetical protein